MRAIIIPRAEAPKYRRILLIPFTGIDATEKADGDYFIYEDVYKTIPVDFKLSVDEKEVTLKTELTKLPVVDLKTVDYKVAEPI